MHNKEIEVGRNYIKWILPRSSTQEFIIPSYDTINPKHDSLVKAIKELEDEGFLYIEVKQDGTKVARLRKDYRGKEI